MHSVSINSPFNGIALVKKQRKFYLITRARETSYCLIKRIVFFELPKRGNFDRSFIKGFFDSTHKTVHYKHRKQNNHVQCPQVYSDTDNGQHNRANCV